MHKQYIINVKSFLKSTLSIDEYFILQIIYEKDVDLFNHLKINTDYVINLRWLIAAEYIKYTGDDINEYFKDPDSLDIVDFVLMPNSTELFSKDELSKKIHEVDSWIIQYRAKFKGIKPNSMGDPTACAKKMKLFLKNNPGYTKENIFNAVDYYISQTESTYITQADYFISKTGNDKIAVSKLLMYCEQLLTNSATTGSTYGDRI